MDLEKLKNTPTQLFITLSDELHDINIVPQEILSFFEVNDIFSLAETALLNECTIYHIGIIIDKVGIVKEFENANLISFLTVLHNNNPDYYPWFIIPLFSKIANIYPEKTIPLVQSLKQFDYNYVSGAIATIIIDNKTLSSNEKYDLSLNFINSGIEKEYLAGYTILENCFYGDSFDKREESVALLHTSVHIKKGNELNPIVYTICNLSLKEESFQNDVLMIRENNNPYTNQIISKFLFMNSKSIPTSNYLKTLLLSFTTLPCEFKGIINDLDLLLMDLLKSDFDLFFEFITKWITESDYKNRNISFCKIWSSFFSSLDFNKQVVLIYTTYFLKDEIEYHRVAADVIHNKGILSEYTFNLNEEIIKKCDLDDCIFLCRKILGHIYDIKKMCDLFNSLLIIKSEDEKIASAIQNLFITLANDYGFVVIDYIKSKKTNEEIKINKLYKNIINTSEKNNELNLKTKDYFELNATYEELFELSRKEFERQNNISKQAEEQSIMSKLCTKIPLKYGIGFSTCYNGKNTSVSLLKEFSTTINMSKQDIYSPVHEQLLRTQYKLCKRGEK